MRVVLLVFLVSYLSLVGIQESAPIPYYYVLLQKAQHMRDLLLYQQVQRAWRARIAVSAVSGFVAGCCGTKHAVAPHMVGVSIAIAGNYALTNNGFLFNERDLLDGASAYIGGVFVGRLANKLAILCQQQISYWFNKTEARVVVTNVPESDS